DSVYFTVALGRSLGRRRRGPCGHVGGGGQAIQIEPDARNRQRHLSLSPAALPGFAGIHGRYLCAQRLSAPARRVWLDRDGGAGGFSDSSYRQRLENISVVYQRTPQRVGPNKKRYARPEHRRS